MEFGAEFWVAISFVIFILLARKPVGKALASYLDARAVKIKNEFETARQLHEEAEAILSSFRAKQKDLAKEVENVLAMAKKEAEILAAEGKKNLQSELAKREKLAADKITGMERNFLRSVYSDLMNTSVHAAYICFQNDLSEDAHKKIFDKSFAYLTKIEMSQV